MKCQKCEKEANFHYQSNINGEISEYHLCEDCAHEQELPSAFSCELLPVFGRLFSGAGFLDGFFPVNPASFGSSNPFSPARAPIHLAFFPTSPEVSTNSAKKNTDNIPKITDAELSAKREISALRGQLRSAVEAEQFEKAAELRDKIRGLEK